MSTVQSPSPTQSTRLRVGAWRLDSQGSRVEFHVDHLWGLGTVKGRFDRYEGVLDLHAEPAITLTIDTASVQSDNRKRDQHLRSAHFFDAEHHPYVRFISDSVTFEDDRMRLRGRLHARGTSIPLEVDAQIRTTDEGFQIEATSTAAHRELGMTFNPARMIRPTTQLIVTGPLVPATCQTRSRR